MRNRLLAAAVLVVSGLTGVSASAAGTEPCATPTITGTDGDDVLRGTPGPDVIDGGLGDDRLVGRGGDDVLCGGPGADVLRGGPGDDRLVGGTDKKVTADTDYYEYEGDLLSGGAGDDRFEPGSDARHGDTVDSISFEAATGPVTVDLAAGAATGEGADTVVATRVNVTGSRHDDVLLGSDEGESLTGGRGADRVDGRGGDDWVDGALAGAVGDRRPNVVLGGSGDDVVNGDAGDDLLRGGPGGDLVQALGGADRSYGGSGSDGINDEVTPAPGQVFAGGPGDDYVADLVLVDDRNRFRGHTRGRIDLSTELLTARFRTLRWRLVLSGFEEVSTPVGDLWTLLGTEGADRLSAGTLDRPVRIRGRGGDDRIFGSDADDVLDGGPGRDTGTGWGGRDRIISIEKRIGGFRAGAD
ncbi:calcium-binding protein [Nocardioides abyssi]|uniref:Calcium-binding protein n=1 Tax=Nocardioides abyssi TaxID=3058370 RepID=A0ABT8EQ01_9ACTN|nr:calcium-binding protein [Nocardioides abyssi]MDN4160231.1 calcium-binding protein [Nocardioides abyssi]